ncbi:hypothetical protein GFS31_28500 [Leptolyngbya sp. BL0902]|nr:hypothetical protein GFS31_28500 [Leptolyngbya sp. BL0902]
MLFYPSTWAMGTRSTLPPTLGVIDRAPGSPNSVPDHA